MMRYRTTPTAIAAATVMLALVVTGAFADAPDAPTAAATPAVRRTFTATAYALRGKTADGTRSRPGVVAADLRVLPLGTRIRVTGAGAYSGDYEVADSGPAVKGRKIDIYVASSRAARAFGRRRVEVEVLAAP